MEEEILEIKRANELLRQSLDRQTRYVRIFAAISIVAVSVVLAAILIFIPRITETMRNIDGSIRDMIDVVVPAIEELDIERFNEAVDNLSKAVEPIASLVDRFN